MNNKIEGLREIEAEKVKQKIESIVQSSSHCISTDQCMNLCGVFDDYNYIMARGFGNENPSLTTLVFFISCSVETSNLYSSNSYTTMLMAS